MPHHTIHDGERVVVNAKAVAERYECVFANRNYFRSPPAFVRGIGKQRLALIQEKIGNQDVRDVLIFIASDCVVLGQGVVISNNCIIEESLINIRRSDPKTVPFLQGVGERSFVVHSIGDDCASLDRAILLKSAWSGNYGHWLVENFARLSALNIEGNFCDYPIIVPSWPDAIRGVIEASFSLIGIDSSRLRFTNNSPIRVGELVMISPVAEHPWVHHPEAINFLSGLGRQADDGDAQPGGDRVFFSRRGARRRRMLNEEDVREALAGLGFISVDPESLSLLEQIRLCRDASVIVGPSGAALTNLIFSRRNPRVLALANVAFSDDFFWDLTSHRGGIYASLHGESLDPEQGSQADFVVDPGAVIRCLNELIDAPLPSVPVTATRHDLSSGSFSR